MMRQLTICLSLTLFIHIVTAQDFSNLDFEQLCSSSKTGLCHWDLSWGGANSCKPDVQNGNSALLIELNSGVGWAEQQLEFEPSDKMKVVLVKARLKSKDVSEKGAGLNVGIYNTDGALLFTKDAGNYGDTGWMTETNDWQDVSINAVCPPGASVIKIGGILYGPGKAWFDDFEVEIESIEARTPSLLAETYISAAMDTVAKHSLRKDSVNLKEIKRNALLIAGSAKAYSDCHLAVEYILSAMEDHHSFFMNAETVRAWEGSDEDYEADIEMPSSKVESGFGYINVPPFHDGDSTIIRTYAKHLQQALSNLYAQDISGWVIDLRENTGGNMEPMIAGLGPVFSSDVLGYLVDVYGVKEAWIYDNGKYMWDDEVVLTIDTPIELKKQLPIAVLMSQQTGSSGEIVLISFIGNKKTRTFGQPSWGLTTGNGDFDLMDGSRMYLASTHMADRNGNVFYGPVQPNEYVDAGDDPDQDPVLKRAIEWLNSEILKEHDE